MGCLGRLPFLLGWHLQGLYSLQSLWKGAPNVKSEKTAMRCGVSLRHSAPNLAIVQPFQPISMMNMARKSGLWPTFNHAKQHLFAACFMFSLHRLWIWSMEPDWWLVLFWLKQEGQIKTMTLSSDLHVPIYEQDLGTMRYSLQWGGHSKCGASHNPFILIHQFNRSPRFDVKTKTPTTPQTNNISTKTVIFSNYLYHYVIMYLLLKQQ